MKIIRFKDRETIKWGVIKGDTICEMDGDPFSCFSLTSKITGMEKVKFLPPCQPTKIVSLGLNYRDHAEEVGMPIPQSPILFLKPSTSVIGHKDSIIYPEMSRRVDYEAELAVVIKKVAKNIGEAETDDYILGYTCFNDVTARDLQPKDGQWTIAKGFDTFSPIGPWIETDINPNNLDISCLINGERRQHSNTKNLILKPNFLVSFISKIMTLLPGDVIATGTPSGIGPMKIGDRVDVIIEGIGKLSNTVVKS